METHRCRWAVMLGIALVCLMVCAGLTARDAAAQTADGVRLWVNGEPLIGKWVDQNTREWSGRISLEAGERYPIKMEYFEGTGGAVAKLLWGRPGVEKRVVPRSRLYLPGTPPPIDGERWSDPATWG